MNKRLVAAVAALALSAGGAFASPGHGAGHGGSHEPAAATAGTDAHGFAFGAPGDPNNVSRTIRVLARDVAFDQTEIRVRAGETVRFVLVNDGALDHEITVGDAAAQSSHRAMMQSMSHDAMLEGGHAHPNSVAAAPGLEAEFVWTFTEKGEFEFACNIPGHAELGMAGRLIVE